MKTFIAKPVLGGTGQGPALVTGQPINFSASFSKPKNILPGRKSEILDRHHELFHERIKGKVLVFPTAVGSTYTGMILLDLIVRAQGPAALVVERADSLVVSGAILAQVWCACQTPIVEISGTEIRKAVKTGDLLSVNGFTGEITLSPAL